jgi:BASS family bile acid:Na+ symporter
MDLAQLIKLGIGLSVMLIVVSLGMRATFVEATSIFRHLFEPPYKLLRAIFAMNVVVPAIAATVAGLFDRPQAVEVAIVAMAISPVPPILPGKQMKFGGHARYVFGLLIAVSLTSIVLAPLAVQILGRAFRRDLHIGFVDIAQFVAKTVLLPLGAGLLVRQFAPSFADRIGPHLSRLAFILLIAGLLPVLYTFWPGVWSLIGDGNAVLIAAVVLAAVAAGHWLGGPDRSERTALAITSAMRHPGIALAIAGTNFPDNTLIPAAILLYVILATIVTTIYGKFVLRRDSVVLARSHHA